MISTLIATNPDSSDVATMEFTSGIDSTYDHYMFVLTDMHPETDAQALLIQFNESGVDTFDEPMTTTVHALNSQEGGTDATFPLYQASTDQVGGTAYQRLSAPVSSDSTDAAAGILHLFNPASTTYNALFYGRMGSIAGNEYYESLYMSGFIANAAAIDEISFKFASGNMNGTIQMYGIA